MDKEIPIACSLADKELQERRKNFLDKIAASLIDSEELPDGFRFRFSIDASMLQNLITVINLERRCCPFLNFKLSLEAGKDFASLDLTGKQGAKEAIKKLFDWNWLHFFKQAVGNWLYQSYGAIEDKLKIETIECELSLRKIYDRIEFDVTFEDTKSYTEKI